MITVNDLKADYKAYLEDMEHLDLTDIARDYTAWLEHEIIERERNNNMSINSIHASYLETIGRLEAEIENNVKADHA